MPEKKAATGQTYTIDDKLLTWTTDEGQQVRIPLRIKLGLIRKMGDADLEDVGTMFTIIDAIAPGQEAVMDEQDINDFQAMFQTWQDEYNLLNAVSVGESSRSSDSSTSTEERSSTTGDTVSASA